MGKSERKKSGLRKNGFLEGTVIAYVAILITKLLGAVYSIPFYAIIGEAGGVIYACAYNIYTLFLNISTSGIPTAMSILVSRYVAQGRERSKERAYRIGKRVIFFFSLLSFVVLFLFAEPIGGFLITNREGGVNREDVAAAVRVVSLCLLVVPFLSVKRGYLQGHKFISASSTSQVIEQLVRVLVILAGSFIAVRVLGFGAATGVCVALSGAALGAFAALCYLTLTTRKEEAALHAAARENRGEKVDSPRKILGMIASYCIPVIIVSVSTDIYNITDMKLLLLGMSDLGYEPAVCETVSSVIATWAPKICMIISALAIGMTSSLVPHMADSYVKGDDKALSRKFSHAINTVLIVTVPFAGAMILLSKQVYAAFYGESAYGPQILGLVAVVNVLCSVNTVATMSLQSFGHPFVVCATSVSGFAVNAALDLPLIHLFARLGLPAYLGAPTASIIGWVVALTGVFWYLKRKMGFRYRPIRRMLARLLLPTAAMLGTVALLNALLPPYTNYATLLLTLLLHFVVGGTVYLVLAYFTGALNNVVGRDFWQKLRAGRARRG